MDEQRTATVLVTVASGEPVRPEVLGELAAVFVARGLSHAYRSGLTGTEGVALSVKKVEQAPKAQDRAEEAAKYEKLVEEKQRYIRALMRIALSHEVLTLDAAILLAARAMKGEEG